jgi:hypothetical protein
MDKPEPRRTTTPWEKFVSMARKVVQTPKADVDKREREWREKRNRQKRKT